MPPATEFLAGPVPPGVPAATAELQNLVFSRATTSPLDAGEHAFLYAAGVHGLMPLLGQRVQRGELSLSPDIDAWLVEQAQRNHARLTRMRSELLVTLDAFRQYGVELVPLKGSAMLLDSPDAVAWRPMADLDVLVRHPDQQQVDLAFARAGYCFHSHSWKHRVYGPCDAGPPTLHLDGEHPDNPRDVECHDAVVEMFRGFRWDITPWIVNNLRHVGGVRVPNDRAMSLHLALHLSMSILEATTRMVQVVDFASVAARAGTSGIEQAIHKSGADQYARFVYPAVALTTRTADVPALSRLETDLRPHVPRQMQHWVANLDFHSISWTGREDRGLLDRLDVWGRTPAERARMVTTTLAPTPDQLASAGYPGSGPLAILTWYPAHYRHLLRRLTAQRSY